MNKIFKVIWNHATQTWTAVSELSKVKAISSSSTSNKPDSLSVNLIKAIAITLPLATTPLVADAYVEIAGEPTPGHQSSTSANARPGSNGVATRPYDYMNPGNKSYHDANNKSNTADIYSNGGEYAFGIAIGNKSSAISKTGTSNAIAIGDYAKASGGLSTTVGAFSNAEGIGSTAIGTAARAAGFNSLAIMRQSAATGDYSAAIGSVAYAKGTASFAFGASATANGAQSIAIGNALPRTLDGLPGGGEAKRTKYDGLNNTQSNGDRSVAFGTGARTNGNDSFAFGSEARTGGFSKERDEYLQEDIYRPGYNVAEKAIAFGSKAVSMGTASVAFGSNSYGAKENSIAFGVGAMSRETNSIAFGTNANTSSSSSIAFGTNAQASHENVITIGKDSKATRKGAMTIGEGAQSNANNSLALGSGTIINQEDIKNRNAKYTNDGFDVERGVVAIANKGSERRLINLAAGREDTDAVNVKQLSEVNDNLARTIAGNNYTGYSIDGNGRYTYKAPDFYIKNKVLNTVKEAVELAQTNYVSVNADKSKQTDVNSNYDNLGAKGKGSIALGEFAGTTNTAENSVAIGLGTKIVGKDAIALGANISTVNDSSIAIGKNTAAGSADDFSNWANLTNPTTNRKFANEQELRDYFAANQNNNDPIYRAVVGKRANIAIGDGAATKGGRNISIGENAGVGTKDNWNIHNVNIGSEAGQRSKKDYSVAIGYQAGALTEANQTLQNNSVIKDGARSPSVLIGKQAGKDTIAYGTIAIGQEAGQNIADNRSVQNIAIGNGAGKGVTSDNGQNNNFRGFGAGANTLIGAAAGQNLSGDGTVAIGNLAGRDSKGDNNIMMGHLAGSNSISDRSIIMGPQTGSNALNNDRNVLIGNYVNGEKAVSVANSVGIGSSAVVTGNQSISIGRSSQATADNTIAQGTQAKATAENAIALGREANVSANAGIALGLGNKVSGSRSTAIGANNTVSGENTVVLGNNITAATNESVVLGDNSKTEGSHATENVTQAEVGGYIYTGFAGTVADAGKLVSVGGRGSERQIKNVAAGHIDANSTDAINGSQLYAVASRVEQGWNITSSQTGTGEVTGNTTQTVKMGDTVKVIAGNNVKVTQDGKNLTVATKENVSFTNVTTGNTSLDNDGLTIKNGPSVTNTGINAGNKTITNVANGTNDSDAVNVSQLNKLGNNTIKLGGDKNTATETQQLNKVGGLQFDVVGGDNQKYVETKASGSQVAVDLTKETKDKIDNAANNNLTNITEGGKTIIRNEAKKAIKVVDGKNTTVTKGADGETDTYAVNVQGDLADVTSITNKTSSGKVEFADNGVVNIAGNNPISLNGKRGDITGLTNKTIDGADFAKSGRAATEEQLKLVGDSKIGDNNIRLGGNTGTTDNQTLSKQGGLQFNVKGGDNAQYVATTASGTDVTVDLTQDTKDKIDNAANNNLTNITNEGKKVITALGTVVKAGDNVTVDETSDATTGQKTYTVNAIAQNLGDALLSYKSNGDASTKQSVKVSDGLDFINGNYTIASVDKNGVVKYDVVLGEAPTINDGKPGVPGQPGVNGKDGIATVKTVVDIINNSGWLGNATGNVASGSAATATIVKPGTTVNYAAGQNLNIKQDVATNGDHTYTYALEKDLTDINSISNGTNKIELGKDGKTILSGGDVSVDNHKITDVVNGTVNANSKDAVNGSQLYATNQNITNNTQNITKNTDDIAKGLNFKGDNANVTVNRQLGETLSIVGGETDATKLADNNIGVIGDANGSLTVKLAKTLKDLTSAEFKDGDKTTIVNGSGITINSNNPTKTVSLTDNGLNNGGNKITNIAEGTDGTDAVNVNQLNKVVNASVSTEKVKAADDANNLATVTPQNGQKFGDPNATYEVSVSKDKVEQTAELTYKANGDATSAKQTTLQKGLDFQATGDYLTASVADNGVVNYAVTIGKIAVGQDGKAGADGTKGADGTDGKNGIATTEDISKAINSSGWKATAKADGGKLIDTATSTVVKPGNEVAFAAGKNLSVKQTINGENQQYTYSLDSELTNLDKIVVNGKDGQNGKDGVTITGPNGQNGEDGKVGISGKDGKDAVSITGKDGVGHIGLTGPAGKDGQNATADISVKEGKAGVDGGDGITRIVYQDKDGKEHEVATHDDGMKYYGDAIANTSVIKKRLNEQVNVVGGITDRNKLSEENNIGVISDGSNNLTARLAKNLNGIESITDGKSSIVFNQNGGTTIKGGDVSVDGNKITNLKDGDVSATSKDAVNGSQLYNATNAINTKGLDFGTQSTGSDSVIHKNLGEKLEIVGKGEKADTEYDATNIKTITENGKVVVALAKDLTANNVTVGQKGADGKDGVDGTISVNGKDGSSVVINGKDGSIGLNGKDGANGLTIKGADGKAGVDGKDGESKTRIVYETKDPKDPNKTIAEEVATLNDGLRFKGDTGDSIAKKLNEELEILGRLGKDAAVTDKNLRVDNENGRLILKMAKQLQDLTSATFINNMGGKSVIDGNGLVITSKDAPANKVVSVTDKGLNSGGNQIVNVDSGLKDANGNKVSLANATGDTLNNAVNVGDLKESVNNITDPSKGGGFGLTDEKGSDVKAKLGETVTVKGDGSVTTKVVTENGKSKLQIGLDKDVTIGNNKESGTITVKGENGQDGVAINGKGGSIGLKGTDGKDGIALNGKDGTIGINGKDGSSGSITVVQGQAGLDGNDGKDGSTKTRIVYQKSNGETEEVATLNDGLRFTGNNGVVNNHKLNSLVSIKGEGVSKEDSENFKSASGNINVKADGNGTLEVQLAKDLKNIDSISNKDGQKIEFKEGGTTISGGNVSVDGNKITKVKAGEGDTDAVNVKQLKDGIAQATTSVDAGKNIEVVPTKNADGSTTYTVKTKDNVDFTTVTTGNTTMNDSGITIKASDSGKTNVVLTNKGLDNGGNKVVNVANGDISSTSKDAVNGSQLHNVKQDIVKEGLNFKGQSGQNIHKNLGETLEIVGKGEKADTEYDATNIKTYEENGKVVVALAKDLTANKVTVGEKGANGRDGADGSIGVNGKDGSAVVINGKDGSIGLNGKDGKNGISIKAQDGKVGVDGKDGETRLVYVEKDNPNKTHEIATTDDGLKFTGNNEVVNSHKLNSKVTVKGEGVSKSQSENFKSAKGNINVKADGKGTLEVQLAKNIDLGNDGSVRTGDTIVNNRGVSVKNGPSMTADGINAGNKKITNVAPGEVSETSTDAVNGSQLYAVNRNINNINSNVNGLNNKINKVDKDLRAGIAGAAAIAGLPQVRGNGKSMVAVAASNYRGENAVALGYTKASDNGKVLLKLSGSTNTRGDVVSAVGLGYEW